MISARPGLVNAFCVDLEEWFHVCGVDAGYSDPASWDSAPSQVIHDTEILLQLLDETCSRGTFLAVGWIAHKHPALIRRIAAAGHEVGCHGYNHRLLFTQTPREFEEDLRQALDVLRAISGQPVTCYRAPGFSMRRDTLWAYPILRRNGIEVDVSIVPARRDHGGLQGASRDPFLLLTEEGPIKCFPVSVMSLLGINVPFSGGGYLRLFPQPLIAAGYRQNHRQGRIGMAYIHPREVNPEQPRLKLPLLKSFKYYVNLRSTQRKLRATLETFRFTTVSEALESVTQWPEYELRASNGRFLHDLRRRKPR